MKVRVTYYTIENQDYLVLKEVLLNGCTYLLLVQEDTHEFRIRKVVESSLETISSLSEWASIVKEMVQA